MTAEPFANEGSRIPRVTSAEPEYVDQITPTEALACLASALHGYKNAPHMKRWLRLAQDEELMAAWEVVQAAIGAVEKMVDEKRDKAKGK